MSTRPALAALLLACAAGAASAAEESPIDIAQKARGRGALNLRDLRAVVRLTTVRDGQTREQVLETTSREIGGRLRSLARFLSPASVEGVTVLTVEGDSGGADDVSIWLPKLRRVRKVASSQRGQTFMDTDFTYADLGGLQDGAAARRLADAAVDGREAYVLEADGADGSPYGRVTVHVDKETFTPLQVDYADRDGRPLKQFRAVKLRRFKDRVLAAESVMKNLRTGSETRMSILEVGDSALGDDAFTERALERR